MSELKRPLNEFSVVVRYNEAVPIIHKVCDNTTQYLTDIISSLMPFGLNTNYRGNKEKTATDNIALYTSNGITYISPDKISKNRDLINKYKVLVSKTGAEHAGEPGKDGKFRVLTSSLKVVPPYTACTHSYFVIGSFDKKEYAENLWGYLKTKFVRFLILQAMTSINLSKLVFPFVPMQDFSEQWNDRKLYDKYNLTNSDIQFIESIVKEMA